MELIFNKIYVIESLPDFETQTGSDLHNDIIKRRLWSQSTLQSDLISINSKSDLFAFFEDVKKEIISIGIIPFFHFEIHGNSDGFVLKSNEGVSWMELHHRFVEINLMVNNKIWISLATCFGAYIYSIISPVDRAPFYGYVGAWTKLNVQDLQASFECFFDILLDKFDIYEALKGLNRNNPNLPVEYKLYTSKAVFNRVYEDYENTTYYPEHFKKRLSEIVQRAKEDVFCRTFKITDEFIEEFATKMLIENREGFKKDFQDRFYMVDVFPENKERFDL